MRCSRCGSDQVTTLVRKKTWLRTRGDEHRHYVPAEDYVLCDTCESQVWKKYECRNCGCHWCGTCVRGYGRMTIR